MLIIPAIDLKDGRCVRLQQGRMDTATVFSDDPVAMAKHWSGLGARRLHIVDLNGAIAGRPKNEKIIRDVIRAVGDATPIEIGVASPTARMTSRMIFSFFGRPAIAPFKSTMCRRRAPSPDQCFAIATGSSENTVAVSMR